MATPNEVGLFLQHPRSGGFADYSLQFIGLEGVVQTAEPGRVLLQETSHHLRELTLP